MWLCVVQNLYLKLGKSYEQEAGVFEAVAYVEALRAKDEDKGEAEDDDTYVFSTCCMLHHLCSSDQLSV
jgi:hypothetical protein